jgi:hypothetical protein
VLRVRCLAVLLVHGRVAGVLLRVRGLVVLLLLVDDARRS